MRLAVKSNNINVLVTDVTKLSSIRSGVTDAPSIIYMILYMVPVRVTGGALVAHRYTYSIPRCITWQYHRIFIPLSVSLWNDVAGPVFDLWD